jgi:toxin-antitoxin system PIN domain toxin
VIVVDANLLIYAYRAGAEEHQRASQWLGWAMAGSERVGLPWSSIHAFLRLMTNTRLFNPALTPEEATSVVDTWLDRSNTSIIEPGTAYWPILARIITTVHVTRDLIMDAHLAALAIEHDATLYTADRDFRRFAGLRVVNPLA